MQHISPFSCLQLLSLVQNFGQFDALTQAFPLSNSQQIFPFDISQSLSEEQDFGHVSLHKPLPLGPGPELLSSPEQLSNKKQKGIRKIIIFFVLIYTTSLKLLKKCTFYLA
jgi:hypothetical protein